MTQDKNPSLSVIRNNIENLLAQVQEYRRKKPEIAKELSEEVVRLAEENGLKDLQASGLVWLSRSVSILQGSSDKSITLARQAVEVLSDSNDKFLIARTHNNLGNCLTAKLLFIEAMEHFNTALALYRDIENFDGVCSVLGNIGNTYKMMGLYDKAFTAYSDAIEAAADSEYVIFKAAAINNLGALLMGHDEPERAEKYFVQALILNREAERKIGEGHCLHNLGELKTILGDYDGAEESYLQAITVWKELGSERVLTQTLSVLADLKETQGKMDEAEAHLIEIVETSRRLNESKFIASSESALAEMRIRIGKTENTEAVLKRYLGYLKDSGEDLIRKARVFTTLSQLYEKESKFSLALESYKEKAALDQQVSAMEMENDVVRIRLRTEFERSERDRKLLEVQKLELGHANNKLKEALDRIRRLSGMLPICANCKKIRNDTGYWEQIEMYISEHSEAVFSHSLCPKCTHELYSEFSESSTQ